MDRSNTLHVPARVNISDALSESTDAVLSSKRPRVLRPLTRYYLGLAAFMCSSAAVIVMASLLALTIK